METMWLIGISTSEDTWMCEGVFKSERAARSFCKKDEFIVEVNIGERLPQRAEDALKLYYPHLEEWKTSKLYKIKKAQEEKLERKGSN